MLHGHGSMSGCSGYTEGKGHTKDLCVPSRGDLWAKDIPVAGEVVRDRFRGAGRSLPESVGFLSNA